MFTFGQSDFKYFMLARGQTDLKHLEFTYS